MKISLLIKWNLLSCRNWARWKAWRSRRRQQEAWIREEAERIDQVDESESQEVGDGQLCVVCLRRRRRSAFVPCGHLVCCSSCAFMIERDETPLCPICRQSIRSSVRVYDPWSICKTSFSVMKVWKSSRLLFSFKAMVECKWKLRKVWIHF